MAADGQVQTSRRGSKLQVIIICDVLHPTTRSRKREIAALTPQLPTISSNPSIWHGVLGSYFPTSWALNVFLLQHLFMRVLANPMPNTVGLGDDELHSFLVDELIAPRAY